MRRFYTLLLYLLLPYIVFHLLWRGRKQPGYLRHIGERFGFYPDQPAQPVIWLHTVSVGETRAAAPLVEDLLQRYPHHRILLTHMTPTGRETSEKLFGERVLRCYLPYDYPCVIRRFLKHFRPQVGLLLETEIWFNLIAGCRAAKVPLLLVNARMSEKSAHKFGRVPALIGPALAGLAHIAAQTGNDAQRLKALGAPAVEIMGNLKFDIAPPEKMVKRGKILRMSFGATRPIFLAASTREGEEALLLDALPQFATDNLLFVIVPRHPQRFDEVAQLLEARGLKFQRRSANLPIQPETQVVLGDNMGELFAYYAACDVAFIGGSLLPLGGQNLIEATSLGKPVLIGPHTFNFAEATELAIAEGAALRVADCGELAHEATRLLADDAGRAAMAQAGLVFSRRHRGATARLMALLAPYLV
jgi:3-deoxy-D-manno-octulosonic-acid transferase